jgi:hypothetical protein
MRRVRTDRDHRRIDAATCVSNPLFDGAEGVERSPTIRSRFWEVLRRVKAPFASAHRFAAWTRLPRFRDLANIGSSSSPVRFSRRTRQLLRSRQSHAGADPASIRAAQRHSDDFSTRFVWRDVGIARAATAMPLTVFSCCTYSTPRRQRAQEQWSALYFVRGSKAF